MKHKTNDVCDIHERVHVVIESRPSVPTCFGLLCFGQKPAPGEPVPSLTSVGLRTLPISVSLVDLQLSSEFSHCLYLVECKTPT